ncbi:ABC transporter, membrane protein [uncultured Desulfobacterium sp.]|uniref:ABC transporter, membrane protein n=1 Tax=uncultured Desulfobacterium sp. TaxID=201089 RepID=A0A445MWY2_9BACT|nr:ABC transporter, membrane protein [uncultured Desulfobacterium sp.]
MHIPIFYSIKNLWTRRLTTILTVAGMALVVFVFAAILMLAEGLEKTLVDTGSYDNVVVIRKGSGSEVQSGIEREKAAILQTLPEIATAGQGQPLSAREMLVLISLPKKATKKLSNVAVRGIEQTSLTLRPQVRITEGRAPQFGALEIMVGKSIVKHFSGMAIGQSLTFGMRRWRIVGIFDAGNTGFNSEVWGDVDQMMPAFRRPVYSSVIFKLRDATTFSQVKSLIDRDPRLSLDARRETQYYKDQSEMMAKFLRILGTSLTIIFSIGATVGAMITMYSAVANRTREIGVLRALGFPRKSILSAFLIEAMLFGVLGGAFGLFFASFMQLITVSTLNFQSFAELSFSFTLSSKIASQAMLFSIFMGFAGGLLPAIRASQMKIVDSLRA